MPPTLAAYGLDLDAFLADPVCQHADAADDAGVLMVGHMVNDGDDPNVYLEGDDAVAGSRAQVWLRANKAIHLEEGAWTRLRTCYGSGYNGVRCWPRQQAPAGTATESGGQQCACPRCKADVALTSEDPAMLAQPSQPARVSTVPLVDSAMLQTIETHPVVAVRMNWQIVKDLREPPTLAFKRDVDEPRDVHVTSVEGKAVIPADAVVLGMHMARYDGVEGCILRSEHFSQCHTHAPVLQLLQMVYRGAYSRHGQAELLQYSRT